MYYALNLTSIFNSNHDVLIGSIQLVTVLNSHMNKILKSIIISGNVLQLITIYIIGQEITKYIN